MKAIECRGIVKKFGSFTALRGVDLDVEEGETFGLLGVNGAGKTTLVRILSCLSAPGGGEAKVCGFSLGKDEEEIKRRIAVSPQETSVALNLTVRENLDFFASVYGLRGEEKESKIAEIISSFELEEVLSKRAKNLSGGWQRRLSTAVALVSSPKVLFLDEPTLGLDVLARRELWKVIRQLKGKTTVVLTSHYLDEIENLCDRVAVLVKGELLASGTVDEIKERTGESNFEDAFVKIAEGGKKI